MSRCYSVNEEAEEEYECTSKMFRQWLAFQEEHLLKQIDTMEYDDERLLEIIRSFQDEICHSPQQKLHTQISDEEDTVPSQKTDGQIDDESSSVTSVGSCTENYNWQCDVSSELDEGNDDGAESSNSSSESENRRCGVLSNVPTL
eukprot:Gb_37170 [translate_table: standard]